MKRWQPILLGLLAGGALAIAILLVLMAVRSDTESEPADGGSIPVHLLETPVPAPSPRIRTQAVTIYQRALTTQMSLKPLSAQIVWMPAPAERARQIVRLVLEGVPEAEGAVRPTAVSLVCREVFVDGRGTAWVDLQANGAAGVLGSDEEQTLVAALARSLVEALEEVERVGVLVGGESRKTLAGHVDLTRTYTGLEWDDPLGRSPDEETWRVQP